MSMLVRKGTMLHRSSTSSRRNSRRRHSSAPDRRQRSSSLAAPAGEGGTSSLSAAGSGGGAPSASRSSSADRRFSRFETCTPPRLSARLSVVSQTASTSSLSADSRRPSSAASQLSSSEHRKLHTVKISRYKDEESAATTSATYSSVCCQLREVFYEARGLVDFVHRALNVLANTSLVTVLMFVYMVFAALMAIYGVQHLRECPKEPNIPIYLLVAGGVGALKMATLLWRQAKLRRYDRLDDSFDADDDSYDAFASSTLAKVGEVALTVFLVAWFVCGNYWVYGIYKPKFRPRFLDPRNWCDESVFFFAMVQLYICYSFGATVFIVILSLALFYFKSSCS